jgi:hypothetical protein
VSVRSLLFAGLIVTVYVGLIEQRLNRLGATEGEVRADYPGDDRLDNGGVPSAVRIHPEWQDLEQGERLVSTPNDSSTTSSGHPRTGSMQLKQFAELRRRVEGR